MGFVAVISLMLSSWVHGPMRVDTVDDWALRALFPAMLAIVLAFAPKPENLVGYVVKDLTVLALIAVVLIRESISLMIVFYPLILATAVLIGLTDIAARIWRGSSGRDTSDHG